jgi:hypothetical protein
MTFSHSMLADVYVFELLNLAIIRYQSSFCSRTLQADTNRATDHESIIFLRLAECTTVGFLRAGQRGSGPVE